MGEGKEEEWMDDYINENNIIINNNNNNNTKKQIILLYKGKCQYWVPRRMQTNGSRFLMKLFLPCMLI
jgi:hypothetical protein